MTKRKSDDIIIKVGRVGAEVKEVSLEDGATVEEALEAAGLSSKTSESVRVNGEDVDLDYELSDGERVMLVKDIRGGGKIGKN